MIDWSSFKPRKGSLLLSEPALPDNSFNRAAVLLVMHDAQGTVGFILNKPVDLSLNDLGEDFASFSNKLYEGGPVQPDTLHYLHKLGDRVDGAIKICDGVYWGGDFEQLLTLLPETDPEDIRFFLGYSGWSAGQLDEELDVKSWIVSQATQADVFSDALVLWESRIKALGGDIAGLANYPRNLNWN